MAQIKLVPVKEGGGEVYINGIKMRTYKTLQAACDVVTAIATASQSCTKGGLEFIIDESRLLNSGERQQNIKQA